MPPKPSAKALGKRKATSPTPNPTPKPSKRVRKSNTKPTDEDSSTPLPSTKTEAEIQILKAQAKKANLRGVRIANKNLESGGPALCGYLGLKDTNSLRHLLFESDVAEGILKRWRESRLLGFQVLERNETSSWQKSHIWNYVSKPGSLTEEQLAYDVPLPQDSSLMKDARGYASWVVTMYRLMEEIPECFEGDEIATDQTLAGRGFEDWNRAYEICRAYYRAHSVSRLGEAIEKKPQNKRAEAPIFLTSEDLAKVTSSDVTKLSADNLASSLEQQDMDEALIDVEEGSAPMKTAELVEVAEDFNQRFEQSFRHVNTPLNRIDAQNNRPRLNRDDQAALCAYIGKKASVLYPQGDAITLKSIEAVDLLGREQAQASLVEEALGDADKVSDRERKRFWALMTDLNRVTAPAPSYEKACQLLQLDPKSPTIDTGNKEPLKPYAWQIVAVAWLVGMEESVLGGGLLADDMGLGKTLVALLLIIFSANLRASRDGENPTVYRPTLIACPSSAYGTWKNEILKFCPTIPHRYYMGSPKQGSIVERARVLPTAAEELRKFVRSLSPTDPKTATTIILTTYTTWLKRTVHGDNSPGERPKRTHTAHDVDDDDDEPQEFSIEELNKLKSDCADLFDRVICDEAHKLKSDRTKTSRAIALLKAPRLIFMTATPMINKPMDLTGVLALLWKGSFMRVKDGADDPAELDDFEDAKAQMTSSKLSADNLAEFVHLLDPTVYRRYAQPSGGAQMDAAISNTILPPILTLIQLRRTMSDQMEVMGKMVKVAAEVPPYRIVTVELRMTANQADSYARIHKRLAGAIGAGSDEETGEGRMDQRVHRLLCHATFNPALHKIAEKAKTAVKNVNRWSERHSDFGASWYHLMTRSDYFSPAYRFRVNMARYMSGTSVKLEWLTGMLHDICISQGARLIIFHDWPMPLWNTTAYLLNLGFEVVDIRSSHTLAERDSIAARFNDPSDPVQVLVTSVRTMSASVNLQQACHHMIFMDVPGSANTTLQAIGRIFRLGQTEEQKVWIVTVDHTYDQVIQARAARKMVSQIAGQGNVTVTEEDVAAEKARSEGLDDDAARAKAIESKASNLYTRMFGQFDSRLEWGDIRDLHAKDMLRATEGLSVTAQTGKTRSAAKQTRLTKDGKIALQPRKNVKQPSVDAGEGSSTGRVRVTKAVNTEDGEALEKQGSHGEEPRLEGDDMDEELQNALNEDILEQNKAAIAAHESSQPPRNPTASVVNSAEGSSSQAQDLPWSKYLHSDDPSHDPDNPQMEDADGESSFPNYFETLDIDDTSTLEEIHKAYEDAREQQKSSDDFEQQLAELDVALKVTTSPHLRQQWLETYAKKIRMNLKRKPDEILQISIPVASVNPSPTSPVTSSSNPINESHIPPIHNESNPTLATTTEAPNTQHEDSSSESELSSLSESETVKSGRRGNAAQGRPKRGAALKSGKKTREQLGGKGN